MVAATSLGLLYMAQAGAPAIYLVVNALALLMGAAAVGLRWMSGRDADLPGQVNLILGLTLLATALFGTQADGAARWVRVGGLSVQTSLIVLPPMLVAFARRRDSHATLGMVIAALALAIQPDRAMAGILASALAVLAVFSRDPRVLVPFLSAATAFGATLLRPDTLPAVPYVDQVLFTAFGVGVFAGIAVLGGAFLLIVPSVLGWKADRHTPEPHIIFGVVWLGTIVASAVGNYPTPVVGYGGSAVLGYALSLALLPPLRHHAQAGVRPGDAHAAVAKIDGDMRLGIGGWSSWRRALALLQQRVRS